MPGAVGTCGPFRYIQFLGDDRRIGSAVETGVAFDGRKTQVPTFSGLQMGVYTLENLDLLGHFE